MRCGSRHQSVSTRPWPRTMWHHAVAATWRAAVRGAWRMTTSYLTLRHWNLNSRSVARRVRLDGDAMRGDEGVRWEVRGWTLPWCSWHSTHNKNSKTPARHRHNRCRRRPVGCSGGRACRSNEPAATRDVLCVCQYHRNSWMLRLTKILGTTLHYLLSFHTLHSDKVIARLNYFLYFP